MRIISKISQRAFNKLLLHRKKSRHCAVSPNRLTSEQVRVVLMLLASDNDRVDAASYVYPSVCDKTSFYIVYDALTFDTAKKELDEKIKAYKDH